MTSPVGPVRPVGSTPAVDPVIHPDRRDQDRREAERRQAALSASRDLVPSGPVIDDTPAHDPAAPAPRPEAPGSASAFAAQVLGQGGNKRGIRGGPPVLDSARSTYLNAEYSGPGDRRPPVGKTKRTDV